MIQVETTKGATLSESIMVLHRNTCIVIVDCSNRGSVVAIWSIVSFPLHFKWPTHVISEYTAADILCTAFCYLFHEPPGIPGNDCQNHVVMRGGS